MTHEILTNDHKYSESIQIPRSLIRRIARERLKGKPLAKIVWDQAVTEGKLFFGRQVNIRTRMNQSAVRAYTAMGAHEFEDLNARQQWANWRVIPKNLNGLLPNRPVIAIDLCCGVGHSTEVLACYLPKGSRILGLEYAPEFVNVAKNRIFRDRDGELARVSFRAQSVLETFRDSRSKPLPDESVDLVNSSGAVGCHFNADTTRRLAVEVTRVLKHGGLAMIDSGLPGTHKGQLIRIFKALGFEVLRSSKSCALDPYTQVCFRKE